MGLKFPCGKELEKLALNSTEKYNPKICVKGGDCSLSGLENQCKKMLDGGESKENIARYCIDFVAKTVEKMTEFAIENHGNLPIIYAGGVMSNSIIKEKIMSRFKNASFAHPDFSCDNAAGIAYLASLKGVTDNA